MPQHKNKNISIKKIVHLLFFGPKNNKSYSSDTINESNYKQILERLCKCTVLVDCYKIATKFRFYHVFYWIFSYLFAFLTRVKNKIKSKKKETKNKSENVRDHEFIEAGSELHCY